MSLLGEVLLSHLAGATNYADRALISAVERLEESYDEQPVLVFNVERAMARELQVGIPYDQIDEFRRVNAELGEGPW